MQPIIAPNTVPMNKQIITSFVKKSSPALSVASQVDSDLAPWIINAETTIFVICSTWFLSILTSVPSKYRTVCFSPTMAESVGTDNDGRVATLWL